MGKFRKKAVVIEAVQLTKEMRNNFGPFPDWALPYLQASRTEMIGNSEEIFISNPSGRLRVFDGDWIIRGTKDGDVYPCPEDVFISTYDPASSGMSFGAAIEALKEGNKVARAGWNGKGQWIVLMPSLKLPPHSAQEPGAKVNDRTAKHIGVDTPLDSQPYFAIWNAQGKWQPGWNPSTSDSLAEDWQIVE